MFELDYAELVEKVLKATYRVGRNGGTLSTFATQLSFDLEQGFPMLNVRKMYPQGVFGELAAMLRGPKHIDDFKRWGCNYWDKWAEPDGSIELDYGNAWLNFNGVNQLEQLREALIGSPESRRMVVTGWRPGADLSLPCCHMLYQFYVRDEKDGDYLDMLWIQRSADVMVGVPSDAIFAAAWMIAICTEMPWLKPGRCTMVFGDTHIYQEHVENAKIYLQYVKEATSFYKELLQVKWDYGSNFGADNFCEFEPSWIELSNINPDAPKLSFVLKD